MGEAVQHPFARAEPPDRLAVILLVQEKAGLLAVPDIHQVADPIFHDLHLRVEGSADKAFKALHPLLETDLGVAALIDAPDLDLVLCKDLYQLIDDHRL